VTDWATLTDAYGGAAQTPALIDAANRSDSEFGDAWNELWSRLCHQGTVYPASYAAIPLLARAAQNHRPAGYLASLQLAGAILASTDGPLSSASVREQYAADIAQLHAVATRALKLAASDREFIYGLEAVMAFEDGGVWQRHLNHLADGELPLTCPRCSQNLLIDLDADAPTTCIWDAPERSTPVTPTTPAAGTTESRLIALATIHDRPGVAAKLPYMFGDVTCPTCKAVFPAASAV